MKPLCLDELKLISDTLIKYKNFQFQNSFLNGDCLVLVLYKTELAYVVIDLRANAPVILDFKGKSPVNIKKEKKPLTLFLAKYFTNKLLTKVCINETYGRVIEVYFEDSFLRISLFPQGKNIEANSSDKTVFLKKPKGLGALENKEYIPEKIRSVAEIKKEYLSRLEKAKPPSKSAETEKKVNKKEKVLKSLKAELLKKENLRWFEAGKYLQSISKDQFSNPDEGFANYINLKESILKNIENCFEAHKKNKNKIINLKERIKEVEQEGVFQPAQAKALAVKRSSNKHQGKTLNLSSDSYFFVGKNAKENLSFLRAAKPWFLWVHLRDFPSCHGFLCKNKTFTVSEANLNKAFKYLIEQNFKNKAKNRVGDKFEILVTECRYVKPIRGDKIGRVKYSNEKNYNFKYLG